MSKTKEVGFENRMIAAVMNGNQQALYDHVMNGGLEYTIFSHFRDMDESIKVDNLEDPEQMYFKGVFDGMRFFYEAMTVLYENERGEGK